MSNFRIKKTPKIQHNMKDSNTLEIKHRKKIEQMETKKKSVDKLNQTLFKINEDLFKIDKQREQQNGVFDLEKRADLLNQKKKLEEEISQMNNNIL